MNIARLRGRLRIIPTLSRLSSTYPTDSFILKSLSKSNLAPLDRIKSQSSAFTVNCNPINNVDTLGIVNMLDANGFTRSQSEALLKIMRELLAEKYVNDFLIIGLGESIKITELTMDS